MTSCHELLSDIDQWQTLVNATRAAWQRAESVAGTGRELLSADMGLAAYEGDAVDLDELVREQITLALPSRRLCREECKGLCPKCGADLNAAECSCERGEIDPAAAAGDNRPLSVLTGAAQARPSVAASVQEGGHQPGDQQQRQDQQRRDGPEGCPV